MKLLFTATIDNEGDLPSETIDMILGQEGLTSEEVTFQLDGHGHVEVSSESMRYLSEALLLIADDDPRLVVYSLAELTVELV